MPSYRVILKKTKYFAKGSTSTSRNLKRYLSKYMDEIGKASQKNQGENPRQKPQTPLDLSHQTLPDETSGVFWTGGFLGNTKSPPHYARNQQRGWIHTTKNTWNQLLQENPSRRNDGFRFVLSLSSDSLKTLLAVGQSPDQALREIWRQTLTLYRQHHNWDQPEHDLGWIASSHHDTQNTHLHILLFPTTKSGKPLRTNNNRGKGKEEDLNNLIYLSNIAAEIYWREYIPLPYQSPTYLQALAQNPQEEPPLPKPKDFPMSSGLPKTKRPTPPTKVKPNEPPLTEAPKWNDSLLSPEEQEQAELSTGKQSLIQTIKKQIQPFEELIPLQSTLSIYSTWAPQKINPWATKKNLDQKPQTLQSLKEKLPQESAALQSLKPLEEFLPNGRAKQTLQALLQSELGHALLALRTGLKEAPSPPETQKGLEKAALLYEKSLQDSDPPEKIKTVYQEGVWARQELLRESLRTQNYKCLLKQVEKLAAKGKPTSNAKTLLQTLIQGSQTLCKALEARSWEAHHATKISPDGSIRYQKTTREWSLNPTTQAFEPQKSIGKPWPPHLDPELILPILSSPNPNPKPLRTSTKILPDLLQEQGPSKQKKLPESPLIRFIKSQRRRRKKLSEQIQKELESPEISPPET